jgi:hypothetical protein
MPAKVCIADRERVAEHDTGSVLILASMRASETGTGLQRRS